MRPLSHILPATISSFASQKRLESLKRKFKQDLEAQRDALIAAHSMADTVIKADLLSQEGEQCTARRGAYVRG